jgi:hypothetical protein
MLRRTLTAALIILLVLVFIEWASSSFVHPCPQGSAGNRCPYEGGVIVEGFKVLANWKPEVWTAIGILVIATFTTILGIFTISLSRSTEIAANAAKLNSQVAIGAERAHLFVQIEIENIVSTISQASKSASLPKEKSPAPRLSYALKNHGKTPAMIREIRHGVIVAPNPPNNPRYETVSHLPVHILGAGEKTPPIQVIDLPRLTANDVVAIEELFNTLWFYGLLVYEDTFGWRRTLDFVWQYSPALNDLHVFRYQETEERHDEPKAIARGSFINRILQRHSGPSS